MWGNCSNSFVRMPFCTDDFSCCVPETFSFSSNLFEVYGGTHENPSITTAKFNSISNAKFRINTYFLNIFLCEIFFFLLCDDLLRSCIFQQLTLRLVVCTFDVLQTSNEGSRHANLVHARHNAAM